MKKVIFILAIVAVMMLGQIAPTSAQVGGIYGLEKSFEVESASLAEHVFGQIDVETGPGGGVVTDSMPEGLALVDVWVDTSGGEYILVWDEDGIEVTLNNAATFTIYFEAQVTDVLSYDSILVTNEAIATDAAGNVDTASDNLELLPYEDFGKFYISAWLEDNTPVDRYAVPLGTKVYFLMYVDGGNSLDVDMTDAYVKDNLGGDLMLEEWRTWSVGTVKVRHTGKTEKAHMMWEIGDVLSGHLFMSNLIVSTDVNPGNGNGKKASGHQEYTEKGEHYLNSGATLKFTASDTGFLCSVSSEPIKVTVPRMVSVTFNVTVPAGTDGPVYIAGSLDKLEGGLPNWDASGVVLSQLDPTHWTVTLTGKESTQIEYKYTLGDWAHVEKDGTCQEVNNRQLILSYGNNGLQTVNDSVLNWRNISPCGD